MLLMSYAGIAVNLKVPLVNQIIDCDTSYFIDLKLQLLPGR